VLSDICDDVDNYVTNSDDCAETETIVQKMCNVNDVSDSLSVCDPLWIDGWPQLRYVDVTIDGLPCDIIALNDSGCQLCVIKADVVKPLNLPKLGEAKLRGLTPETVSADVVHLKMKLAQGHEFTNVTCAVVQQ